MIQSEVVMAWDLQSTLQNLSSGAVGGLIGGALSLFLKPFVGQWAEFFFKEKALHNQRRREQQEKADAEEKQRNARDKKIRDHLNVYAERLRYPLTCAHVTEAASGIQALLELEPDLLTRPDNRKAYERMIHLKDQKLAIQYCNDQRAKDETMACLSLIDLVPDPTTPARSRRFP